MPNSRSDEGRLWLRWLMRLRWVALAAQLLTVGFAWPLFAPFSLVGGMACLMGILLLANLLAQWRLLDDLPVPSTVILAHLSVDTLVLTGFFYFGGGPENPFIMLYLVHIAMGAVMLRPEQAASLTVGVLGCYGALHGSYYPLHYEHHSLGSSLVPIGQLFSFAITVCSVAVFVVGLSDTLRRRTRELLVARDRTARTDRLRSVGTLAAGAAHELNTPLSTLGMRVRRLGRRHDDEDTKQDLQVIRTQLERCSRIVQQLLAGAGDPSAVGLEQAPLIDLVRESTKMWTTGNTTPVTLIDESEGVEVALPRVAFSQALTNLLENARQAQETIGNVDPLVLTVKATPKSAMIELRDHGCGLPKDPGQVGTPFFTTKAAGTGLGVFVARQVADGAGGGLRYRSHPDGTTARWWFPRVLIRRNEDVEGQSPEAAGSR